MCLWLHRTVVRVCNTPTGTIINSTIYMQLLHLEGEASRAAHLLPVWMSSDRSLANVKHPFVSRGVFVRITLWWRMCGLLPCAIKRTEGTATCCACHLDLLFDSARGTTDVYPTKPLQLRQLLGPSSLFHFPLSRTHLFAQHVLAHATEVWLLECRPAVLSCRSLLWYEIHLASFL